jgi:TATA-box binding protein (TBP) (component of TFIID and TFIIIB)
LENEDVNGSYYVLRPCRGAVGFIAQPRKPMSLNLEDCASKLETSGYNVVDANVMLIAQNDVELTIYKSGKILARTDDEESAKLSIEKAYSILI